MRSADSSWRLTIPLETFHSVYDKYQAFDLNRCDPFSPFTAKEPWYTRTTQVKALDEYYMYVMLVLTFWWTDFLLLQCLSESILKNRGWLFTWDFRTTTNFYSILEMFYAPKEKPAAAIINKFDTSVEFCLWC